MRESSARLFGRRGGRPICTLAVAVAACAAVSLASATPTLGGESFNPVLWGPSGLSSQFVEYSVSVNSNGGSSDRGFVNVVRDDGTWVVQNVPVGFEPGSRTMATNVNAALFVNGASYQTTFHDAPQTGAPAFGGGAVRALGPAVTYLAADPHGAADLGPFTGPPVPGNVAINFGPLLGFTYHVGMPDLPQGPNECYPTSAANSLSWMNSTYGLGLNLTTAQIRDSLKDPTHMMTDPNRGTFNTRFLSGKDQFVSEHGLPIVTHQLTGGAGDRPTVDELINEMAKGQDVEITIAAMGQNWGHMVTLVGILDLGPFGVGIAFNDPDDGKDQTQTAWLSRSGEFLTGTYAGSELRFAFAESIPEPGILALLGVACLALLTGGRHRTGSGPRRRGGAGDLAHRG